MTSFLDKFKYAIRGIVLLVKDKSIRIQLIGFILTISFFSFFSLTTFEWMVILLACALVVLAEMVNTLIECLCDFVQPQQDNKIKIIKDMGAGFVLCACIFAVIIGLLMIIHKCF